MATTVLITGANQGLGLETAKAISRRNEGAVLVLAVRDIAKGNAAADGLRSIGTGTVVHVLPLDLASLAQVRTLADRLRALSLPPLDALICNAAVQNWTAIHRSAEGYELTFAVNVLGHALLTLLLLDRNLIAPSGRIVIVSSGVHDARLPTGIAKPVLRSAAELAAPKLPDGESVRTFGQRAYSTSKLADLMFALELDRRLRRTASNVPAVLAFDPGGMPSSLIRDWPPALQWSLRALWPVLRLLPNMSTMAMSGSALASLAVDRVHAGETGRYYSVIGHYSSGAKPKPPAPPADDPAKCAKLFAEITAICGADLAI